MENTLLRVAGALFCHDAKRAATRTQEIELNRGVTEKKISDPTGPAAGSARTARAQDFCCADQKSIRLRPSNPE